MESYLEQREKLIREDRAQRVDFARISSLSETEAQADAIVRAIREEEAVSVWDTEKYTVQDYLPDDESPNVFPGMNFLTGMCSSIHRNP